jgi:hypothetical protein
MDPPYANGIKINVSLKNGIKMGSYIVSAGQLSGWSPEINTQNFGTLMASYTEKTALHAL